MGYAFGRGPVGERGKPPKLKCNKCFSEDHGVVGDTCVVCLYQNTRHPFDTRSCVSKEGIFRKMPSFNPQLGMATGKVDWRKGSGKVDRGISPGWWSITRDCL
jgi:hypothetical protein